MKKQKELVSIIIPVFNRAELIDETIDSVLNQTCKNWELILVDDNSNDNSLGLMKAAAKIDPRIKVFERPSEREGGGNAARNFGFERSEGDLINWFDSDDVMHPDFIQKKVVEFKGDQELNVVFSRTIRTNFKDQIIKDDRLRMSQNILEDYIMRKISWYLPDAMLQRSYLKGKELFDEGLLAGQDRDFYIRLFAQELPKIKILDFYGTYYRMHSASISEKLYREGNVKMQLSHYYSLLNQIESLKKSGKFSRKLQIHYLTELKKRMPSILKTKTSKSLYFKNLLWLSGPNKTTVKVWSQILPAYISFAVFGKGERFLN